MNGIGRPPPIAMDESRLYQPADKALGTRAPAHPPMPRGFAAPSPERMARAAPTSVGTARRPPVLRAARRRTGAILGYVRSGKRRRGKPDRPASRGDAAELRSPRHITGGVVTLPGFPITIVGRRQIDSAKWSLQEQMGFPLESGCKPVLVPASLPRAGDGHSSGPPVAERRATNLEPWCRRGPRRAGNPALRFRSCSRW